MNARVVRIVNRDCSAALPTRAKIEPRRLPPVITTSTPRDLARACATRSEFVITVRSANRVSRRASACVVVPAPIATASPSRTSPTANAAIAAFSSPATCAFSEYVGS